MAKFATQTNKSDLITGILLLGPFILFLSFLLYQSWSPFTWTEEVNVLASELIVVKRSVSRELTLRQHGLGPVKSHSLTITLNGKNVVWQTNGDWKINHMPEILAFIDGEPILIFSVAGVDQCSLVGFPKNSLVGFKYHNGAWSRIGTDNLPPNLKINLLRDTFNFQRQAGYELGNYFDEKFKMVTLKRKFVLESSFTTPSLGSTIDKLSNQYLDSCANLDINKNIKSPKA